MAALTDFLERPERRRRWRPLLIAAGALLLMGFYAATDSQRLAHDHLLAGADWLGAGICHRITARSFVINGRQLPLCARCTGIYLGVALVFVTLGLAGRWRWADLPPSKLLWLLFGLIGVMGIDGLNSYSHFFSNLPHLYEPRNWLRLLTGMGAGLAMGLLVFPALAQSLWRDGASRPVIGSWREMAGLLLVAGTAVLLVLSNQPVLLYVLALVSVAGVLLVVTAINAVLLLALFKREAQAGRWRETAVPLAASLALAVAQIGTVTLLRLNLIGTITGFPGL